VILEFRDSNDIYFCYAQHVVVSSSSLKPLILQQSLNFERLKKFKISKIASRKAGVHISAINLSI
jgi:hypothetical protein